ncbi:MAG: translocation/assembly module TamB domain-containing protein [Candidatus Acidiferrales bacterium]
MKIRWHHWFGIAIVIAVLVGLGALFFLWNGGVLNIWTKHYIAERIEDSTGAKVEIGRVRMRPLRLYFEIDNLTLHGLEDSGMPPLFHADKVQVKARIVSFFGRKVALDELVIERPEVGVHIGPDGKSSIPVPKVPPNQNRPWRERLFDLRVGKLQLIDGSIFYNDAKVPLAVEGDNFDFSLAYEAAAEGNETYAGKLDWQNVNIASHNWVPFHSALSMKFTLGRGAFAIDELKWKFPHSELDMRAELPSFALNNWNFRYHSRFTLADMRTIFRIPPMPDADVETSGSGQLIGGEWKASGHFDAREVDLPYEWFHAGGIETWGDFDLGKNQLVVPQLNARALGGTMQGHLTMGLPHLDFRVESRLRGASLAQVFAALENPDFPVEALHWDSSMDVDSVNTWTGGFLHFRSQGETRWAPPASLASGRIPVTAKIDYDYAQDRLGVMLTKSEISTPTSLLTMDGPLGGIDSGVEVTFHADDLTQWDDFINTIRGTDEEPKRIAARADWKGRVLGPIVGPAFVGHVSGTAVQYDTLSWDSIDGDMDYSPDELRLTNFVARRGHSSATFDLRLQFDNDWNFRRIDPWSFHAQLSRDPIEDLQGLFGTTYPVNGLLSGQFTGGGTRSAPLFDGDLTLEQIDSYGLQFDRLTGQLHVSNDEFQFANGDLRMGAAKIAGHLTYRIDEKQIEFALAGSGIDLGNIPRIQAKMLPIAGTLGFDLHGAGPLLAPKGEGTLQLRNLKLGPAVEGGFDGKITSNGNQLHLDLVSEMSNGTLQGGLNVLLSGEYPVTGQIVTSGFDLDPFVIAGLHLQTLSAHSSVDGELIIGGNLRDMQSMRVIANFSRVMLDYGFVKLQNEGPFRFEYRRNEVTIQQAYLRGADTDFQFSGRMRFDGNRPLNLTLAGRVNLGLAKGLAPLLDAHGAADVRVSVEGTISSPTIIGRVGFQDASAVYDDFPTGLSHVTGEVVFDRSRALFDNVSAQSGGGNLTLRGSVSYGDGPFRFDVDAIAPHMRIRYPEGMSWLAGGTMHLSGTSDGAVLSGNIQVERVLFAPNVDLATLLTASQGSVQGPTTTSAFLRNLQFDIGAGTTPNARMEWTGAHVEVEGTMRLRGTWERPILLGNIHLLNGDMTFRDNKYTLSRGDIIFSNPFRLDPTLNVEATTVIDQYEVTLDFTGPGSNLSLAYRSDPPLPDSDIIALLALGSPGTESALRSSSAQTTQGYGATALLSEAISSQLGGRIERLFGITKFRVDPFLAGTASEQNAAARITIEEQLGKAVTVTYSTNAASQQEQVIQVVYAVRRDISIIALRDINGTFSLSIEFTKHFK